MLFGLRVAIEHNQTIGSSNGARWKQTIAHQTVLVSFRGMLHNHGLFFQELNFYWWSASNTSIKPNTNVGFL